MAKKTTKAAGHPEGEQKPAATKSKAAPKSGAKAKVKDTPAPGTGDEPGTAAAPAPAAAPPQTIATSGTIAAAATTTATTTNEASLSSGSANDGISEAKENKFAIPGVAVVIPFRASMAKGRELLYAMRAWEKALPDCLIIVIGDALPWFSEQVLHIPHTITVKDNPQIDVAQKMLLACESELVPENFVWSNDDIYPLCKLHPADLFVLMANGRLGAKGTPGGKYHQNGARTLKALKAAGFPNPWDYATHTPVCFDKAELVEVIKQFKADKEGHLVSTLYFNTVFDGYRPIQVNNGSGGSIVASVYRPNPDKAILNRAINERKFLNNNDAGWKAVEPHLAKLFPNKSRFEK